MRKLILALLFLLPTFSFAAIAFDTAGGGAIVTGSQSFGMTLGADATALVCSVYYNSTRNNDVSVTWDGVSMIKIGEVNVANSTSTFDGNIQNWLFYASNPVVGSHSVIMSNGSARPIGGSCVSYSGVSSIGAIESIGGAASSGVLAASLTTGATGAWTVMGSAGNNSLSAGTGAVQRNSQTYEAVYDSGGQVPVGNASMAAICSCNDGSAEVIVELQPIVVKSDQTISFAALPDKTYGDADSALSATSTSGLSVSFNSQTPDVCTASSTVHIISAGLCTIKVSQPGDSNYNAAADSTQSFVVIPRTILGSISVVSKVYDATTTAVIASSTLSGVIAGDTVSLSAGSAVFSDKNAGSAKIVSVSGTVLTGIDSGKYIVAVSTTSADIFPAVLSIVAEPDTKIYDGNISVSTTTPLISGLVGLDTASSAEIYDSPDVGVRQLLVSGYSIADGNAGNNYSVSTTTAAGIIVAKPVSVSVHPVTSEVSPPAVVQGNGSPFVIGVTNGADPPETLGVSAPTSSVSTTTRFFPILQNFFKKAVKKSMKVVTAKKKKMIVKKKSMTASVRMAFKKPKITKAGRKPKSRGR